MKRLLVTGTFHLLAGAFTLLLLASIVFSCRSGEDPHQTRSSASLHAPSATETRAVQTPDVAMSNPSASAVRLSSPQRPL